MKSLVRYRGLSRFSLVFVAVVSLCAVPTAHAQRNRPQVQPPPQPVVQIPASGTELFRGLLLKADIEPVTRNDLRNFNEHSELIVIVFGTPVPFNVFDQNPESLQRARRVIAAGGAALIASDVQLPIYASGQTPFNDNPIGQFTGLSVVTDANDSHKPFDTCPYVVPVSPEELRQPKLKPGPVWGLFRGLSKVATNQPTTIQLTRYLREYQYPLAVLPKSATDAANGQQLPSRLFAVGGDGQNGEEYSFLAMADQSVFINQMLLEEGTDNLELAIRTIEYLRGPEKTRKKCLFYENGQLIEKFDTLRNALAQTPPKLPPSSMPNLGSLLGKNQDKFIELLDAKADEFQSNDVVHKMLVGQPGSERERVSAARWVEILVTVLSIMVVVFLLRRMMSVRAPHNVPPPPNTGAGAASTGPPGVFDRREKELVRRNNLYEPVHNLLREFFISVGASHNPGPRIPKLEISKQVRKTESLRQAIRDMWRIAFGPPMTITANRWLELEPYFRRLQQAHADGKWRFVTDE